MNNNRHFLLPAILAILVPLLSPATGCHFPVDWHRPRKPINLDSGLVAYWSFNDSTARDNSGKGNHGIPINGPRPAPGPCGTAMHFDGVDDYIRVPKSASLQGFSRMTVSYWTKFHQTTDGPGGTGNTIGNGSDDNPRQRGFYSYTGARTIEHLLGLQPNGRRVTIYYDATKPLERNEFVFVTFVVTDDSMKAYKNGMLAEAISRDGWPITRDWDWLIGWSGDHFGDNRFMNGYMDEIRIYNRALSDLEIMKLYDQCDGGASYHVASVEASPALSLGIRETRPNPFTETATIDFTTPSAGEVKLEIFSADGRRVALLVEGSLGAGEHSVEWHADRIPTGAYRCRLQVGNEVRTIQMIKME